LRTRKKELGTANSIGNKITALRKKQGMKQKDLLAKLQSRGVPIDSSSLSKLEGQTRAVKGEEVAALLDIFSISMEELYPKEG
jgi:transcriptional regulator with XRE-family HTH domain